MPRSKSRADCLKWVMKIADSSKTIGHCECAVKLIGNFILQFDVNSIDDAELDMLLTRKLYRLQKYAAGLTF